MAAMQPTAQIESPVPLSIHRARRPPGKRYPTPFHFFYTARCDPLAFLRWAAREYGDVVRFDAWPFIIHVLHHPDHIKHVLQDNNRNYWKGNLVSRVKPLIGEGLFTSEGDLWRRQRRLAQPAFHRQRIEGFATIMSTAGARMAQILLAMIMQRYRVDIAPGHLVEHEVRVTVRPRQPMLMVPRPV
jgi:cytochrome P450